MDFVKLFPYELSLNIFGLLSAKHVGKCKLVSKEWKDVSESNYIINKLRARKYFMGEVYCSNYNETPTMENIYQHRNDYINPSHDAYVKSNEYPKKLKLNVFPADGSIDPNMWPYSESAGDDMLQYVAETIEFMGNCALRQLYINDYYHPALNVYNSRHNIPNAYSFPLLAKMLPKTLRKLVITDMCPYYDDFVELAKFVEKSNIEILRIEQIESYINADGLDDLFYMALNSRTLIECAIENIREHLQYRCFAPKISLLIEKISCEKLNTFIFDVKLDKDTIDDIIKAIPKNTSIKTFSTANFDLIRN